MGCDVVFNSAVVVVVGMDVDEVDAISNGGGTLEYIGDG